MTATTPLTPLSSGSLLAASLEELHVLRGQWVWFLLAGVTLVALGSFAIGWACLTTITIAATWLFGFLVLAGGIAEIIHAFSAGRWGGAVVHLLIGVLNIAVGFMIVNDPGDSALVLTKIIAIFLIIGGLFRIVAAISQRFTGWGWVLLNGVVTLLLGVLVYKQWPASGLWFIGLYLGIDMIMNGWSYIMLALMLQRLPPRSVAT
jgi:uncharacterized membrane protein HdeD (DUF308 family)